MTRRPNLGMSKRNSRVNWSIESSSVVRRSRSSVARPASPSDSATWRLRELRRLLPLPCAKMTRPNASDGIRRSAFSRALPSGICTARIDVVWFMLDPRWICLRDVRFFARPRFERLQRTRLVDMDHDVELFGEVSTEIVTGSFALGNVDNTNGSFES